MYYGSVAIPFQIISKVKFVLEGGVKAQTGSRDVAVLVLTLAVGEGGWLPSRSGRLPPQKQIWYPLFRRLGGRQGRARRVRNTSPPPGFGPRTVQPVASVDIDYPYHSPHNISNTRGNALWAITKSGCVLSVILTK